MNDDVARDRALSAALEVIEKKFGPVARLSPRPPGPSERAIAAIAHLAKIPSDELSFFSGAVHSLLIGAWQSSEFRLKAHERKGAALVKKAETHVRAAYDALRAFSPHQRDVFERAFLVACSYKGFDVEFDVENAPPPGFGMLEAMVEALACITGKSSTFEPSEGGRRKKTFQDGPFRQFVGVLWQTVREFNGELSFSCNANKGTGTMVDALNVLRPLLPRLIPLALDQKAKTIDRIKRSLKTETYERFGYVMSASSGMTQMPF
jgi:hypothetical protein